MHKQEHGESVRSGACRGYPLMVQHSSNTVCNHDKPTLAIRSSKGTPTDLQRGSEECGLQWCVAWLRLMYALLS